MKKLLTLLFVFLTSSLASAAVEGAPKPYHMGMQPAGSSVQQQIIDLHDFLLVICVVICVFVLGLMLYICTRYSEKRNPKPATFSHNTPIEIIWTVVPCFVVALILWKSWNFYYEAEDTSNADMTLKVVGYQWYWGYEYPDHGNIEFEARMVPDNELTDKSLRLLDTDEKVVLPVGKKIRILMTAADVIHSWYVPALGIKKDAVPGRTNETWVLIDKPGEYYGVCAEICGVEHGFMPIAIKAVPEAEFNTWVAAKKAQSSLKQDTKQQLAINN